MTARELIVDYAWRYGIDSETEVDDLLAILAEHGYSIIHPDDVPVKSGEQWSPGYRDGWNLCRAHIFGGQP